MGAVNKYTSIPQHIQIVNKKMISQKEGQETLWIKTLLCSSMVIY